MAWRVFAASATGSSHREDGRPCQDAFAFCVEGNAVVAAVCDGAGSCELSHVGARTVAETMVAGLARQVRTGQLGLATDADGLRVLVEAEVTRARADVQAVAAAGSRELSAYASTLVVAVAWPSRVCFVHLGDGYAVVRQQTGTPDLVSVPENGEYVNETYFVTGDEWPRHLRMVAFDTAVAALVLMSDGAAPFAMAKGQRELHRPFFDPVLRYLEQVSEVEGTQALAATLADPRTDGITNDDKTLLIARWT